jgi:hypothetical protein
MKRMLSAALLVLAAVALAQGQPGKPNRESRLTARQRAAQAELEQAQDAYDVDELAQAELHAKKAAELDPSNQDALLFIAHVIEQQYNRLPDGAEKTARAREALQAFQQVLDADPLNDEAFDIVKSIYGELHEEEMQYSWVMQRTLASFPTEKRADAYVSLEWLDRDCAAKLNERVWARLDEREPVNLYVLVPGIGRPLPMDDQMKGELAKGQQCVARGLQMAEQALALRPEDETAWQGKFELLTHAAEFAGLLGEEAQSEQYGAEAEEAHARADALRLKREKEAAASSSPR